MYNVRMARLLPYVGRSVDAPVLNGWYTTARFCNPSEACHFSNEAGGDGHCHYLSRSATQMWFEERLGLRGQPVDAEVIALMLAVVDCEAGPALRAIAGIDCYLSGVGADNSGNSTQARQLRDARLVALSATERHGSERQESRAQHQVDMPDVETRRLQAERLKDCAVGFR